MSAAASHSLHWVEIGGHPNTTATYLLGTVSLVGAVVAAGYVVTNQPRGETGPAWLSSIGVILLDIGVMWRLGFGPASRFGSWLDCTRFVLATVAFHGSIVWRLVLRRSFHTQRREAPS